MKRPIGVFDSGVGGLTVYKEIRAAFPNEDLIYFGDTARVPYGPKSPMTIIEYSKQNARFLLQQDIKILVVACNTSSSVAIPHLKELTAIPILGVIGPGSETALKTSKNNRIGVIGTEGTVRSEAYTKTIKSLEPKAEVFSRACPLFVPLAEEGWQDHPISKEIAKEYISPLLAEGIDTLVLGCTHYPLLSKVIQEVVGDDVRLVDSAKAIANHLRDYIVSNPQDTKGKDSFYVSDSDNRFSEIASRILGDSFKGLKNVRLHETWIIE